MLIKSLHLKNILSFKDTRLDLQPLNVLIGANGSGKSNLIDVIALLQAVPGDLSGFLRRNGPTGYWTWNGDNAPALGFHVCEMQAEIQNAEHPDVPFRYELQFEAGHNGLKVTGERLADHQPEADSTQSYFIRNSDGSGQVTPSEYAITLYELTGEGVRTRLDPDTVGNAQSVFNAFRNPLAFPALSQTAERLTAIKPYRNWYVGRNSPVRHPQPTDGPVEFLEQDFSNLALVINDLRERQGLGSIMDEYLERFYESYKSLHTPIYGNTVSLTVRETGLSGPVPASRLSDGAIRFIALLAILCHPNPPPFICIEEPEIAMHPDSLGLIAELLRKASERTQLIVTTHSPELVALFPPETEAEYVVVCERDAEEGTRFHRPSLTELRSWQDVYQQTGKELVVYGLSEMWLSGAIGGVR